MALFGLIDLTVIVILIQVWLLNKWGTEATRPYRALVLLLYAVAVLYSFGLRL